MEELAESGPSLSNGANRPGPIPQCIETG